MAWNWEHIKGFNKNASSNSMTYTWLKFPTQVRSLCGGLLSTDSLPVVKVKQANNNAEPTNSYGHLLTSNCSNVLGINHRFFWLTDNADWDSSNWKLTSGLSSITNGYSFGLYTPHTSPSVININIPTDVSDDITVDVWPYTTFHKEVLVQARTTVQGQVGVTGAVYISGDPSAISLQASGKIKAKNIEAEYFNAVSDIRAKENIKSITAPVLELVKDIKLYSYNYKGEQKTSIGFIAQDLIKYKINNFKLVENEQASGINNDFMSVRESKLVFILWKAVQELTAKVEDLEKKLNN